MKASIKNAECPKCNSLRWFIHEEASGIGAKTCMNCGYDATPEITEFELFLGVPVKGGGYSWMNAISTKSGLRCIEKSALYKRNKGRMIRTWRRKGDVGIVTTYPIHISTWNMLKKKWGLVKNEDRRIITAHFAKPTGKQKILV